MKKISPIARHYSYHHSPSLMMGGKPLGFGNYEQTTAKTPTKREMFLDEMDQVMHLQAGLIESISTS
jgi:hypothetical protein